MQPSPQKQNPAGGPGFTGSQTNGRGLHRQYTAAPIDTLLARLEGVQRAGKGWRALCPNCGGKSHKLAIAEGDNGALLVNCFSCHDTPAVLAAVGLELADLFPGRIKDTTPEGRREVRHAFKQVCWAAALGVLAVESTICEVATQMILRGDVLTPEDVERVRTASQRIHDVREVLQ